MRYRLSLRLILLLHVAMMAPISIVYGGIDGGMWIPPALYAAGALSMWLFSLPGAKRGIISDAWGFYHMAKMFGRHGLENAGHARRADWDRYGRHSRVVVHAMGLIVTVMFATTGKIGSDWFWQTILLSTSFAIGVETGAAIFKSGDTQKERAR